MRCSLKNKSMTKHEKRGRILIHIPGAWSYPSTKQVTPTHSVNVCMFCVEILLRPSFGMFYKQQTLLFTHENLTATLHSGNLTYGRACFCSTELMQASRCSRLVAALPWFAVYDASAVVVCKITKKVGINAKMGEIYF